MRTKARIGFATLGLLAAAGLACGGDNGATGPSASDLVGQWNAVKAELVSNEKPTDKIDVLAGGVTLTLWLNDDHTWSSHQYAPGGNDLWSYGTWSLKGSTLTITENGDSETVRVTCNGTTMTLKGNTTWDHDLDGIDEPATLTMNFTK